MRTLDTPFFPLVQSGLDGLGADLVDEVSDLELSLAEQLAIGFGGQQLSDRADVAAYRLQKEALDLLRLILLLGGEREAGHGEPPCVHTVGKIDQRIHARCCTRFPTHFRDAYPKETDSRKSLRFSAELGIG